MDIITIANLFSCAAEAMMHFVLYDAFLSERKNLNKGIYLIGAAALSFLIFASNRLFSISILNLLCMFVIGILVSTLYAGKRQMRIFSTALSLMCSGMAEMLVLVCMTVIFNIDAFVIVEKSSYRVLGIIISKLLGLIIVLFINYRSKKREELKSTNYWLLFAIVFASATISLYVFFVVVSQGIDDHMKHLILAAIVGISLTTTIILYLYEMMIKQQWQMSHQQLEKRQLKDQLRHYNAMISSQAEIKQLKHDLNNHLLSIQAKLNKQEYFQCMQYIEILLKKTNTKAEIELNTGNTVLDAIISAKRDEAEKKHIAFYSEIRIPPDLPLREDDICIIFGNALDNAIEACMKAKQQPYISVSIVYDDNSLVCRIENSCMDNIDIHAVTSKDDWKNHGIGRKNIEKSLSHYNCVYDISCANNKYILSMVFMDINCNLCADVSRL